MFGCIVPAPFNELFQAVIVHPAELGAAPDQVGRDVQGQSAFCIKGSQRLQGGQVCGRFLDRRDAVLIVDVHGPAQGGQVQVCGHDRQVRLHQFGRGLDQFPGEPACLIPGQRSAVRRFRILIDTGCLQRPGICQGVMKRPFPQEDRHVGKDFVKI